jgi:hypothetical protein
VTASQNVRLSAFNVAVGMRPISAANGGSGVSPSLAAHCGLHERAGLGSASAEKEWHPVRPPYTEPPGKIQITQICADVCNAVRRRLALHNGGTARGYQGLSARLAASTTDEQAGGPGRMFQPVA